MRQIKLVGAMLAVALLTYLATPGAKYRSLDIYEVMDEKAALLYGGEACMYKSIYPQSKTWCGPQGTCGFLQVSIDTGSVARIVVAVSCGNNKGCGAYPTQLMCCVGCSNP